MPVVSQTPAIMDLGQTYVPGANGYSTILSGQGPLILGNEYLFPCYDRSTVKPWQLRSAQLMTARLVKNNGSAITSAAKKCVAIDPADPTSATALSSVVSLEAYPIDEWVVGTVAANAIFWVITGGLTKVIMAASVIANVVAGDYMGPSGVTAGAVDMFDYSAVPTTTAPAKLFAQALKNARFMATANITAASSGGASVLVQVMP